jgi:hypothetical protein
MGIDSVAAKRIGQAVRDRDEFLGTVSRGALARRSMIGPGSFLGCTTRKPGRSAISVVCAADSRPSRGATARERLGEIGKLAPLHEHTVAMATGARQLDAGLPAEQPSKWRSAGQRLPPGHEPTRTKFRRPIRFKLMTSSGDN